MTDISTVVKRTIAHIAQRDAELITDDMLLREELGLDSLDVIDVVMDLEGELGLWIPTDEGEACTSVGQLVTLCERVAGKAAA